MISKENIKYSLNNLSKRKSRSFLTILSIMIGIATIFVFLSFGLGLYTYVDSFVTGSSADKITIQPRGVGAPGLDDTFALTDDDLNAVEGTSGVKEASGVYMSVAEVKKGSERKYAFAAGYDPSKPLIIDISNIEIQKGRELQQNDIGKAVLGYNYMIDEKIFSRGLDINDRIKVQGKDLTVIGFYEPVGNPQDDSNIYLTNDYFEEVFPNTTGYSMIVASVDIEDIDKIVENVEKSLRDSRDVEKGKEDFYVASFEDLLEQYSSALNIIIGFIILIALISVVVSAINTANTMITSVLERVQEIGIMKSIGARNSEIFKIFLFESSFLGLIAGIAGLALGSLVTFSAEQILLSLGWGFLQPYYSWWLFVSLLVFAVLTGAVSGVAPAINASRTNPVDALRYE